MAVRVGSKRYNRRMAKREAKRAKRNIELIERKLKKRGTSFKEYQKGQSKDPALEGVTVSDVKEQTTQIGSVPQPTMQSQNRLSPNQQVSQAPQQSGIDRLRKDVPEKLRYDYDVKEATPPKGQRVIQALGGAGAYSLEGEDATSKIARSKPARKITRAIGKSEFAQKFQENWGGATGGVWFSERPSGRLSVNEFNEDFSKVIRDTVSPPSTVSEWGLYTINPTLYFQKKFQEGGSEEYRKIEQENKELQRSQKASQVQAYVGAEKFNRINQDFEKSQYSERSGQLQKEIEAHNLRGDSIPVTASSEEIEAYNKRSEELNKRAESLNKEYQTYNTKIKGEYSSLAEKGIYGFSTDEGVVFSSKVLDIPNVSMSTKKIADYNQKEEPLKKYTYMGAGIARKFAISYGTDYLLGASGIVASLTTGAKTLATGKALAAFYGSAALTGGVLAYSGYKGYEEGSKLGVGTEVSIFRGLGTAAEIVGSTTGVYKGTKAYYSNLNKQFQEGAFTKSTFESRKGVTYEGKTITSQKGEYITELRGTDYKIESSSEIVGNYADDIGSSKVYVSSNFMGDDIPQGLPKSFTTQGGTLETDDLIYLRTFSKSPNQYSYTSQDTLISRNLISRATSTKTKGVIVERIDLLPTSKTLASSTTYDIPDELFTTEELINLKGFKAIDVAPFVDVPDETIGATRQYVSYNPPSSKLQFKGFEVTLTDKEYQTFESLSKSSVQSIGGFEDDYIRTGGITLNKDNVVKFLTFGGDKRGTAYLTPKIALTQPKLIPPKTTVNPSGISVLDSRTVGDVAVRQNLQGYVGGLYSELGTIAGAASIPLTTSIVSVKNLSGDLLAPKPITSERLSSPLINTSASALDTAQKVTPKSTQKIIEQSITKQVLKETTSPITPSPPANIFNFPTILPPFIPPIPPTPSLNFGASFNIPKPKSIGAKPEYSYTPSYTALVFGIRGKKANPKYGRRYTGFEVRPITSGWTKQFSSPFAYNPFGTKRKRRKKR